MREIDSAHDNSEVRLRRALRSLTASSPADAPSEIGDALTRNFRRHHARRRAVRRTAVAAAIVAVLLPTAWLMRRHPAGPTVGKVPSLPSVEAVIPAPVPVSGASGSKPHAKRLRSTSAPARMARTAGNDFVALPSSDQAVQGEDLRVIRLELTGRALRMVGAPVSEDIAERRMLADFVVGQDGTPYAVRLVR